VPFGPGTRSAATNFEPYPDPAPKGLGCPSAWRFGFVHILDSKRLQMASPPNPKATPKLRQLNKQLSESALRNQAFWDNSPNLIFLKDKELRYLYVNREFERALRVNRGQIRGKKDHDVFPQEQACASQANDLGVLNAGVPI
jgi:PAS domain-containing protein